MLSIDKFKPLVVTLFYQLCYPYTGSTLWFTSRPGKVGLF